MKQYWLRANYEGHRWLKAFTDSDDRRAIERGLVLTRSLMFPPITPFLAEKMEQERRRAWRYGRVELVNEVGVIIHEWESHER